MKKKIAVIPGDGIGPEVTQQAIKILDTVASQFHHQFDYSYCLMGAAAIDKTGHPLPDKTIEVCLDSDAILLGAIGHPKYDSHPAATVRPAQGLLKLRKSLQLFANIHPIVTHASVAHLSPLKNKQLEQVDFIIFRELTGGIYFGDKQIDEGFTRASDECVYTREEIERVAHPAFQYAQKRRKKLTLVDKANVLATSRLWRRVVQDMMPLYPDVTVDFLFADHAAAQFILAPRQFDVLLTANLFGDILSDEANVLTGAPGLLPSASVGNSNALFEPIQGSHSQIAGKDVANPVGSILSAAMMLEYFGMNEEAALVRTAVDWSLSNGFVTRDIDPVSYYSTSTIGDLIKDYIENKIPSEVNKNNIALSKSTII